MTTQIRISFPLVAAVTGALAASLLLFGGPATPEAGGAPQAGKNIVQTAAAAGQFKTLVALVKHAGLAGELSNSGKLTVFAPTDAAFKRVPRTTLTKLRGDRALLRSVLLYHVTKGNVRAARVVKLKSATTLNGERVRIAVRNGAVYLNGSTRVIKTDVSASNGTIHVVDRVLLPPAS